MNKLTLALIILAVLVAVSSVYVVQEPEQVIITQFGKPVGDPIQTPGLHFKIPLIQEVHRFDKRFLEWDGDPNELTTKDKRFIYVNMYARWQITDPLLYFQRLNNERGAQTRLDDILDGETRNAIASFDLEQVVRSTNRVPVATEAVQDDEKVLGQIGKGRPDIRDEILAKSQARTSDLGIEILDMEFKRINYTDKVQRKVYERMISERQRIAERFRSVGQGEAFRIRGTKDRELLKIRSEAYRKAQEIKGQADADATRIYAEAYNRSAQTRSFYEFLKTMESYKTTLDKESTLVLTTEGDFYRFLKRSKGQ
ncbi:protease modulator HflC [bacterium CG17_big_fil_post_rev_8_21_14_2_50_64_8]|nr:MAG: protease modulator HflC [bacterium CG17_big_fil_post_rev_8_21_14_2_50_64_8]PJA73156.1 MAG: protease modulator HflC [bacterium CG_4_9_14_3_um_filter_65_15]